MTLPQAILAVGIVWLWLNHAAAGNKALKQPSRRADALDYIIVSGVVAVALIGLITNT